VHSASSNSSSFIHQESSAFDLKGNGNEMRRVVCVVRIFSFEKELRQKLVCSLYLFIMFQLSWVLPAQLTNNKKLRV